MPGPVVVGCTIVARNYLPAARVLRESWRAHHPGARFAVLVVDGAPAGQDVGDDVPDLLGPADLDLSGADFLRMATAYSVTELCTAVKPWVVSALLRDADVVVYLDPDTVVYSPFLAPVARAALQDGIVLTPHVLRPPPRDGQRPTEADTMASGVFNLGFLAVSAAAAAFLDYWAQRLRHDAVVDPERQLFTDQRWVDNVPALFGHHVLRDPALNVAYWNLHERTVALDGSGRPTVDGRPMGFFHFSGHRPERPWLLTTHFADRPRVLLSQQPAVGVLTRAYGEALRRHGYGEALGQVPYGWATLDDGTQLSTALRREYRDEWVRAERSGSPAPPAAFGVDAEDFRRWLTSPVRGADELGGLGRWGAAVWRGRPDVQIAYPEPAGRDRDGFTTWCATSGVLEGELPRWAVPAPAPVPRARSSAPGVNLVGYFTAELGVGEIGRAVVDAVERAGLPVSTDVEEDSVVNRLEHAFTATVTDVVHPVTVLCVNADMVERTVRTRPELSGTHTIGLWSWETEDFPASMRPAFELVDEVWANSDFCAAALAEHATVPVHTLPVPVRQHEPATTQERVRARQRWALGSRSTVFLFIFDFNSLAARKNPRGLVSAFLAEFGPEEDVRLVLKSINAGRHPEQAEELRWVVGGDPRVLLVEDYLSTSGIDQLYAAADCYVSLHRAEGFGFTVAEAAARGLPVVLTGYSATNEVLPPHACFRVASTPVAVGPGLPPYGASTLWAEPDRDSARAGLRRVHEDPAAARRTGAAGRDHVRATRSPERTARWVRERIEAGAAARTSGPRHAAPATAPALTRSRDALLSRSQPGGASRNPAAPLLRTAVQRALGHHDHHERVVLAAVVDDVEHALLAVHTRVADLEIDTTTARRVDVLERELHRCTERSNQERAARQQDVAGLETATAELHSLVADLVGRVAATERELDGAGAQARAAVLRSDELAVTVGTTAATTAALDGKTVRMFTDRDRARDVEAPGRARDRALVVGLATAAEARPVEPGQRWVTCDVGVISVPEDDVFLPWLRAYRSWEVEEAALIAELLVDGTTFLDVGAHVGYHTLKALAGVDRGLRAVAVEADADLAVHLRRNVDGAGLSAAVEVVELAAWDVGTTLVLHRGGTRNSGDNRVLPPTARAADATVEVQGRPLDDVLVATGSSRVSVIKTDLQGADHRALRGLRTVLAEHRPHVVCEFDPSDVSALGDDPAAVLTELRRDGTELCGLDGTVLRDADVWRAVDSSSTGFTTLWVRPLGSPDRRARA